jgi:archaemetzincin
MRNQACLLLGIVMALSAPVAPNQERLAFAIQPLGKVDASLINLARQAISEAFGGGPADTMAELELPAGAYYEPRKRYRAEKILVFLDRIGREKGIKVIGLTSIDISTTKGRYEDWGIFGMANIGGPSCIVSTYRLGREKVVPALFAERVKKVVIHELGHALGLPHCETPGCVMQDAEGKISTIDRSDGRFCPHCKKKLGHSAGESVDDAHHLVAGLEVGEGDMYPR